MLRCCQLFLLLYNKHGTCNVPIPWPSPDVKVQRLFYATKSNLRDNSTTHMLTPNSVSIETDSTLVVPESGSIHNTTLADPIVMEGGHTSRDPMLNRLDGAWIGSNDSNQPVEAGSDSLQHQTPTNNSKVVLIRASLFKPIISGSPEVSHNPMGTWQTQRRHYNGDHGTALMQGLPNGGPLSTTSLAHVLGLVQNLTDATTARPLQQLECDLLVLKSTLRHFGSQLVRQLDATQSADLLCFLGTISDNQNAGEFHSSHGGRFRLVRMTCWEEVIKIAEVKQYLGHLFGDRENYWTMRAYLERSNPEDLSASREMAKLHFSMLSAQTRWQPSVLVLYLNGLLSHPSMPDFDDAVDALCTVLTKPSDPDRTLVECLWRFILTYRIHLSPANKSTLSHLTLHRLSVLGTENPCGLIGDIFIGFAASLFPCYRKSDLPNYITSWINNCICTGFAEEIPLNERFNNLVLLAKWLLPQRPACLSEVDFTSNSSSLELRIIIGVAILDQALSSRRVVPAERNEMKGIAHSLLDLWKHNTTSIRPKEVERAVAIAFLRISGRLGDRVLLDESTEYIFSGTLYAVSPDQESEARQVEQLFSALARVTCASKIRLWPRLLSLLWDGTHSPSHLNLYLRSVLQQIANHDVELALQFYDNCLSHEILLPVDAFCVVAQQLALKHSWDQVVMIIRDVPFDDELLEQLLGTILAIFHKDRSQSTIPALAEAVGDALLRRYSHTYFLDRFKYAIRFFLPIMITSHHPKKAVQVMEVLLTHNPDMFSHRFFLRMIRTLLRHRQPTLAIKVLELAAGSSHINPAEEIDLIRKTRRGLIQVGANKLAFHPALVAHLTSPENLSDRLLQLSLEKSSSAVKRGLLRLFPVLTTSPVNPSLIFTAVSTLTKRRCFALARQLIRRCSGIIEPQWLTKIGNVYLHAPLRHDPRNGRLVRHVLRTKDYLGQAYGFIPDRVTVNIVIKAMLRWKTYIDSSMVLSLFDHLVRNGYPASERWLVANGVPFGTPLGEMTLDLSGIHKGIKFTCHVRPLYRMFIKELFLRDNRRAAHRIVGILKEEEALAREKLERSERARRRGVARKLRKPALARQAALEGGRNGSEVDI